MATDLMPSPLFRKIQRRRSGRVDALSWATLREFSGGLTAIDTDLNLDPKFAVTFDNVHRLPDGSVGVRPGTRKFGDSTSNIAVSVSSDADQLTFTNTDTTVRWTKTDHNLLLGHKITISGVSGAKNGVPDTELNAQHTITNVVDDDNVEFEVTTAATSTGAGSADAMTVDYDTLNLTGTDIIAMEYFQDYVIAIDDNGEIIRIDANGVHSVIWNDDIAGTISGAPSGWTTGLTYASFTVFGGKLLILNGIDKPLVLDMDNTNYRYVDYIVDAASGANTNTPVCRYAVAMGNVVVMAGDPTEPSTIYVSNQGTYGTWENDNAPNNATSIDVANFVDTISPTIRGISRFRGKLIIGFDDRTLIGSITAGATPTAHTIDIDEDTINEAGSISHDSMIPIGADLLMCDQAGVPSVEQTIFTNTSFKPGRPSQLVDPLICSDIADLTVGTAEDRIFALHDRLSGRYMLFIPNANTLAGTTETVCYVYTRIDALKVKAWSRWRDWNWRCGCVSSGGRLFFGRGTKVYIMGTDKDPVTKDRTNDSDVNSGDGEAISFVWESPWIDFNQREAVKHLRYVMFDATGGDSGAFTFEIYTNSFDAGGSYSPVISIDFTVGPIAGNYGYGEGGYGSGGYGTGTRTTRTERPYAVPCRFKIMKFRMTGDATDSVKWVSMSFARLTGGARP